MNPTLHVVDGLSLVCRAERVLFVVCRAERALSMTYHQCAGQRDCYCWLVIGTQGRGTVVDGFALVCRAERLLLMALHWHAGQRDCCLATPT